MKTLKTTVIFARSLIGVRGDRVQVIGRSGTMLIIQNVENGKKGVVSANDLL